MLALLSGAWEGAELCGRAQVEAKIRVDDDDGLDWMDDSDRAEAARDKSKLAALFAAAAERQADREKGAN